jgi:hypothetical protein
MVHDCKEIDISAVIFILSIQHKQVLPVSVHIEKALPGELGVAFLLIINNFTFFTAIS